MKMSIHLLWTLRRQMRSKKIQQQKRKSTGIFQFAERFCILCALPPIRISSELLSVGKDALGKYICRSFYFATEPNFKIMFSYEEYAGQNIAEI